MRTDHPKLSGLAFGIDPRNLVEYATFLMQREHDATGNGKTVELANLPISVGHHPSRELLLHSLQHGQATAGTAGGRGKGAAGAGEAGAAQERLPYREFLQGVGAARHLVSPVGDRADTYRHMEAIGLGTVPICNCPETVAAIYGGSMLAVEAVEGTRPPSTSPPPPVGGSLNHSAGRQGIDSAGATMSMREILQDPARLQAAGKRHVRREMIFAAHWKGELLVSVMRVA